MAIMIAPKQHSIACGELIYTCIAWHAVFVLDRGDLIDLGAGCAGASALSEIACALDEPVEVDTLVRAQSHPHTYEGERSP